MVRFMSNVKEGICPSCTKERPLAVFHFGVIKTTICIHCLKRYLDQAVIPRMLKNNRTDDDESCMIGLVENEK